MLGVAQECKRNHTVCGDFVAQDRTPEAAAFIVLDGIGSGIKANVAAQMFASRLVGLLRRDFTAMQACEKLANTMHRARSSDALFAAFTLMRVLNDGSAVLMSYEMPAPLIIEGGRAEPAPQRFFTTGKEVVGETLFKLQPGNAILVMSDGVSQCGMGSVFVNGWGVDGVRAFVNQKLSAGAELKDLPQLVVDEARRISGGLHKDDATAVLLTCRPGSTIHILTGPPAASRSDSAAMQRFAELDGTKVVCGSTTADIFARNTGRAAHFKPGTNAFEPPEHEVEGIDLVTEGAVTLNHLYNIIEEADSELDPNSSVSKLLMMIRQADRVYFHVGGAKNPGNSGLIFRQLGLLPRHKIVPLIVEKLRADGKLVITEQL